MNIVCYVGEHLDLTCFITGIKIRIRTGRSEVPNLFAIVCAMYDYPLGRVPLAASGVSAGCQYARILAPPC